MQASLLHSHKNSTGPSVPSIRLAHALVDFAEENLVPNQSFDFLGHDGPFP